MDMNKITIEEALENLAFLMECSYIDKFEDDEKEALRMGYEALKLKQQPCNDAISKQAVMNCFKKWQPYMATRLWDFVQELSALPLVNTQELCANEIDQFVNFLIRENCDGCAECEPRVSTTWKPKFACVEEGRTKWFLHMAEKYKAEKGGILNGN